MISRDKSFVAQGCTYMDLTRSVELKQIMPHQLHGVISVSFQLFRASLGSWIACLKACNANPVVIHHHIYHFRKHNSSTYLLI